MRGFSGDGGPARNATLGFLSYIASDAAGNLFFPDSNRVRKITAATGIISTIAGSTPPNPPGFSGDGGPATNATLSGPDGIAVDGAGNVYIRDGNNARIRKVDTGGIITTIAGNGNAAFSGDGGLAINASISAPFQGGLAVDAAGNVYIADQINARVRRVSPDGLITTVAGIGSPGNGDGGPATSAVFTSIGGVAFDAAGTLYVTDGHRNRVRKITRDGIVQLVAGAGDSGFAGDGGPAVSALLNFPQGIATDAAGNIFIAERVNNRIRKITPDGIISTVAGSGARGFAGDGGPARNASLNLPYEIAFDRAANLYIADSGNNRVRKVTPAGIISTVAGNGQGNFSGDGGPATLASLNFVTGVAVDATGVLYLADRSNNRIRRVALDGTISTVAGNGQAAFAGDGGPAVNAALQTPEAVVLDKAGNLYIVDTLNYRIRKVTPNGIISTIIGTGVEGFSGDGGPATAAQIDIAFDIAFDDSGNLYFADTGNGRIRAVLANAPSFFTSISSLSFSASSGGAPTPEKSIDLTTTVPGLAFNASASTTQGGGWLRVTPVTGTMPLTIEVTADPSSLQPGTYSGTVTIQSPNTIPAQRTVNVTFSVGQPIPAKLGVRSGALNFSFVEQSAAQSQALRVSNDGGGSLTFTVSASTSSGGSWLAVAPPTATVTASTQATLTVTANPAGLDPGTYTGQVLLTATTGERAAIPVNITVSGVPRTILLSQTGLTFIAVASGGRPLPQTFGVLNTGQGVMQWSAAASTLSGGANWLAISSSSGSSTANSADIPLVEVRVDPTGLPPGDYYGQVRVSAPSAGNSPQIVSIVLNLLPPGANPGPMLQPNGLIFAAPAGGVAPSSQNVLVSNLINRSINYVAGRLTADGQNWFVHAPTSGTVAPDSPARIVLQVDQTGLAPGVYRGVLTLLFLEDGITRSVNLLLNVLPPTPGASAPRSFGAPPSPCAATKLLPVFTSLPDNFSVPAAWPVALELRVVDDCGSPQASGTVAVSFSNGDPPLNLASLRDGRWSGTWQPRNNPASQVILTADAQDPQLNVRGSSQITGGLQGNQGPPLVAAGAVVNAASFAPQAPLAPGTLISIFGTKLAESVAAAQSLPLDSQLATTSVVIAGQRLPLLYVSDQQVNAIIPFEIAVNTRHQLVVQRGSSYGVPEPVTVAVAQPAVFSKSQTGSGQGIIVDTANRLVEPGNPAHAGDAIVIYCSGLGAVNPTVAAGTAAPLSPLSYTSNPVTVTIGGVESQVLFAGLTPGFSGVYQINAIVPKSVSAGDAVPVVLSLAGQVSPPVTIAVQ